MNSSTSQPPEIITVSYNDLILCKQQHRQDDHQQQQQQEQERSIHYTQQHLLDPKYKELMQQIGSKAFGTNGLGIVLISNVPNLIEYRKNLLPLAAQIPYINTLSSCIHPESYYSVGWSHGKETISNTGQPDLYKGSYYGNPLTNNILQSLQERYGYSKEREIHAKQHPEFFASNIWPSHDDIPNLELHFCNLGKLLYTVGCYIAQICDDYCYYFHNGLKTNIAKYILQSYNMNGRLLHYFPNNNHSNNQNNDDDKNKDDDNEQQDHERQWCSWHNDHSVLTGLVSGMYIDTTTSKEIVDIYNKNDNNGGLYIQARNGQCIPIHIPYNCCAYQIGETSQIMSGGILQATPHCILRPTTNSTSTNISRESFALFLEPEFHDIINIPSNVQTIEDCQACITTSCNKSTIKLRPLSERWKPGQTFGEFHLATVSTFTTL